jgi:hypothetical protein
MTWKNLIEDQEDPDRKPKDIRSIARIIESLFSLLPAIMIARQVSCLRSEASPRFQKIAETGESILPAANALDLDIDQNLQTIQKVLKVRDEEAKR